MKQSEETKTAPEMSRKSFRPSYEVGEDLEWNENQITLIREKDKSSDKKDSPDSDKWY